jgi:hypothetical protein
MTTAGKLFFFSIVNNPYGDKKKNIINKKNSLQSQSRVCIYTQVIYLGYCDYYIYLYVYIIYDNNYMTVLICIV